MPLSKLTFVRSTVLLILLGASALGVIVLTTLWLVSETRTSSARVTEARVLRSALADLRSTLQDAETGQRGYLLSGKIDYLQPYLDAMARVEAQLAAIRRLIADRPDDLAVFNPLTGIIADKLAELKNTVELAQSGRTLEAQALVNSDRGRRYMLEARIYIDNMLKRAETRISQDLDDQRENIAYLGWITIAGAIAIFLVVGGSIWAVVNYTRQLVRAEQEVRLLNVGLEERVQERTADLHRANEEIQHFAYIVTHDLRAPLVNIMGFTSEMETSIASIQAFVKASDVPLDDPTAQGARSAALDDVPEALGFIRSSTRKMDGLINAILKLSREGRRTLRPEPIDLDALLKNAAASVHHQVAEAGGDIRIEARVPKVVSDRLALEQIFGNLFDNAIKYRAPSRAPEIQVRARELNGSGQRIVIEVADNGRGIAPTDHERIFDLFRRSGVQDKPGEGIGLAHVRAMVRNLGGDITVASELDRGTTMTLRLPQDLTKVKVLGTT